MKTKSICLFLLGCVLVFTLDAAAQSNAFTYQGRLLSSGAVAEGLFDVRFTLFAAETNGTATAGPVTNLNVTVTSGLFTTMVDFGTNIYDGTPYWLELAVRPAATADGFTALAPRQALTPVPYALHARDAKLADKAKAVEPAGVDTAALADASVTEAKLVNRGITSTKIAIGAVTADELSGNAVTTDKIADGSIVATDLSLDLLGMTFWRLDGNAGTAPGTHFLGTMDNQPLELRVNGQRVLRLENNGDGSDADALPDGAPNVLGGSHGNYISPSTVGATIAGGGATNYNGFGRTNSVRADYGTVGGGFANHVFSGSIGSTVAGGTVNRIGTNAQYAVIGGGGINSISTNAHYATVAGGFLNDIGSNAFNSVVSGGGDNNIAADARYGTIAGGFFNNIGVNAWYGTIGGGINNTVADFAQYATIAGGFQNRAATRSYAAGTRAKAIHDGAFVWADGQNTDFASTSTNQFNVRASGGARFETGGAGLVVDGQPVVAGQVNASQLADGAVTAAKLAANSVTSTSIANGAVNTAQLADGAVTAAKVAVVTNWFALTIPNPTPENSDYFGSSMAAMGSDRLLIGASSDDTGAADAGAAYLFNLSGALLTTFTNPSPATGDNFGYSVAAVGNDRVLIGAYLDNTGAADAGAAYLFRTNGTLLTTFTNPTPAAGDLFGWAVMAVGSDRVLISAIQDDTGAADAGTAYLFSTNGTLLTTITNPTPANGDWFGVSVAAVGSDRVLIAASSDDTEAVDAGVVYLFATNGTLLITFINPTPAIGDRFGTSVAVASNGRVLIGANSDDTGALDAGAAYLFSTNGTLLTTFTNPTPAASDNFGYSVAVLGNDRVLIGAYQDDTSGFDSGAAYLFSADGTLLSTFTNPTPAASDLFGYPVVAVGSDRVLVGAYQDDTGANDAGAAYLFRAETFANGLVASGVRHGAITTGSLADGAVTSAKIAPGSVSGAQIAIGAVEANQLADGAVTAKKIFGVTDVVSLLNLTNPSPASSDFFGSALAAVGTDRVLVGAHGNDTVAIDAGEAYLFDLTGKLITTFTNPTPAVLEDFGFSVTGVGTNRLLIGAPGDNAGTNHAGAAYLFDLAGNLLTVFTNPTPAIQDRFGAAVAGVGADKVIIGVHQDDLGANNAGVAYLFDLSGNLITTFTNPTPANSESFGFSVAAVGTDRVLIGAYLDNTAASQAGAAYLFDLAGNLLTAFTDPTPNGAGGWLGVSVAAVGTDRVLIGASTDSTGGGDVGAALLFDLAGNLLTTFTNPVPTFQSRFGVSVAGVGLNHVLIGAYRADTNATDAGVAYLFDLVGNLVTTILNPTPAVSDEFGLPVAPVGTNGFVIGAIGDNTGGADGGAAYLYRLDNVAPGFFSEGVRAHAITAVNLDPSIGFWTAAGPNIFRGDGNVGIGNSSPSNRLMVVNARCDGNTWISSSDRQLKENFAPVDALTVLEKVAALPITTWNYKADRLSLHLGPVAQDFNTAFKLGSDDTSIATVDADGVALAAIQGLNQKVEEEVKRGREKEAEIQALKDELATIKQALQKITRQKERAQKRDSSSTKLILQKQTK